MFVFTSFSHRRKVVNNVVTKIATPYSTGHIPCPYNCGRSFKHATQKAIHVRKVHTGERPFVCKVETCKKAFYSSGDLKSHEKTHSGLKPFECPTCGKALSSRNALKVHTKALHTLERPFKCEVPGCGMTYMTRLDLDRHVKKHNKWEQKEEKAKMQILEKRHEKAEKKVKQLETKLHKKEAREQKRVAVSVVSAGKLVKCQPGEVLPEGAVAYFVPNLNGSNTSVDKLEVCIKRKPRKFSSSLSLKSPGGSSGALLDGGNTGEGAEDGLGVLNDDGDNNDVSEDGDLNPIGEMSLLTDEDDEDTTHGNNAAQAALAATVGGVSGMGGVGARRGGVGGGGSAGVRSGGELQPKSGQKRKAAASSDPEAVLRASKKKLLETKMREEYEKQGFKGTIPFQSWRRGLTAKVCAEFAEAVENDLANTGTSLATLPG